MKKKKNNTQGMKHQELWKTPLYLIFALTVGMFIAVFIGFMIIMSIFELDLPQFTQTDDARNIDDYRHLLSELYADDLLSEYEVTGIDYMANGGLLELPVNGATGWAAHRTPLRSEPRRGENILLNLDPAHGFIIIEEYGDWWYVQLGLNENLSGWVEHRSCFINLPDVIPSVIYNITNSTASIKRSRGVNIPNVTGLSLYNAYEFNYRLNRYSFIVPASYITARRLAEVQQSALADGNTIVVYEAFRPLSTQRVVSNNLRDLINVNETVRETINTPPWHIGWFIASGVSSHQRGSALDVSLRRIAEYEIRAAGDFIYKEVIGGSEHFMPSAIHELSPEAVVFSRPVNVGPNTPTDGLPFADTFTSGAMILQNYFLNAGFTPLASEWWHFDDPVANSVAASLGINGDFFIDTVYSRIPIING